MEGFISKKLFRKTVLEYRRMLSQGEYVKRNERLMESLLNFLLEEKKKYIHVFLPIKRNKEPNIFLILPKLWEAGINTVTSITNFELKSMSHIFLNADTDIKKNELGIPEPQNGKTANVDLINIFLIPLLVADRQGNRIGYGGGYYDRLLKETKAVKVGLNLSDPVDKITQNKNWDVPLNFLITPFKIYKNG
ncbi:MAG: 5-formyltetrahydrofolate cyclo-ligase [Bacteroidota bacterium]